MKIVIRAYTEKDLPAMVEIWNQVVEDGVAFPQEDALTLDTGRAFFAAQTYDAVAEDADTGRVYGVVTSVDHPGLPGTGEGPRFPGDAVQRRGGLQHPRAAPVRAAGLRAAGHYPGRLPHEGRAL